MSIAQEAQPQRHPFAIRQAAYWVDFGRGRCSAAGLAWRAGLAV
ncbi:MAG: hypothetical protein ACRDRZ_08455 [Pseudonocardiaceae bacterium]